MKITREEILHVANLARLEIEEEAIGRFSDQIGQILEYVETLNQVNTDGVAPTSHAISLTNAFREDVPTGSIPNEDALANAPEMEDGFFVVPKVIE